jgi:hypothetical protein
VSGEGFIERGRIKHTTPKETMSVESGNFFMYQEIDKRNVIKAKKKLVRIADVNYIIAV